MATQTYVGSLGEVRSASTAAGGTALTTAAQVIALPDGTKHVFVTGRNYSTAVVAKVALVPYLVVLKTTDNLATATDYSVQAQDGLAATNVALSSLSTAANLDYLYVGSHLPFRGVAVTSVNANGNASTLTVKYWDGAAWTDITATDGSAAAGATLGQSGLVTWTVPAAWAKASLMTINSPAPASAVPYGSDALYWTRWQVSAALDGTTDASAMLALSRSTAYAELIAAQKIGRAHV